MKNLMLLALSMLTFTSAYAQIDDVINKPKEKVQKDPSISGEAIKSLLNRFQSIEISTLVDDMKRDGVQDRKFKAMIGFEGRLFDVNIVETDYDGNSQYISQVIPFTIKLTSDKKVYISTAILDIGNLFEQSNGETPVSKAQFIVFKFDEGTYFRDVKSVGWRLVDFDLKIATMRKSSSQYLAVVFGGEVGKSRETITLDNGQMLTVAGRSNINDDGWNKLGTQLNLHLGLELKDHIAGGVVTLSSVADYRQLAGSDPKNLIPIPNSNTNRVRQQLMTHQSFVVQNKIAYTRNIGKKTTATLGLGLNVDVMNRIQNKKENSDQHLENTTTIDLKDRLRQPYSASLIIKF